jgi:hypothetical protein
MTMATRDPPKNINLIMMVKRVKEGLTRRSPPERLAMLWYSTTLFSKVEMRTKD